MQQTETYQLNLIETSDTFSPAPLNENAQKIETALVNGLAAVRAEAAAGDAAVRAETAAGDAAEANARANADAAEAQARADADAAEANARAVEAQTRANADAAEAQTRANADAAEAYARAAADAALEQRIISLEGHKFAGGAYAGSSEGTTTSQFINLGFTPMVVLIYNAPSSKYAMFHRGITANYHKIVEGGFSVCNSTQNYWNSNDTTYSFIAIG